MQAFKETTGGLFPAHTYLLDGTTLVAYIKVNETQPFYFKNGIKGFDKRGRKFVELKSNPFKKITETRTIKIAGSKGNTYEVDPESRTCTCPGFTFRGACKHIEGVSK
jgi:superfamily I DNA and/or RNA helicase